MGNVISEANVKVAGVLARAAPDVNRRCEMIGKSKLMSKDEDKLSARVSSSRCPQNPQNHSKT